MTISQQDKKDFYPTNRNKRSWATLFCPLTVYEIAFQASNATCRGAVAYPKQSSNMPRSETGFRLHCKTPVLHYLVALAPPQALRDKISADQRAAHGDSSTIQIPLLTSAHCSVFSSEHALHWGQWTVHPSHSSNTAVTLHEFSRFSKYFHKPRCSIQTVSTRNCFLRLCNDDQDGFFIASSLVGLLSISFSIFTKPYFCSRNWMALAISCVQNQFPLRLRSI